MAETASYGYIYIANEGDVEMAYSVNKNGNRAFTIANPQGTLGPGGEVTVEVCFLARSQRSALVNGGEFSVSIVDVPIDLSGSRMVSQMFPPKRDAGSFSKV